MTTKIAVISLFLIDAPQYDIEIELDRQLFKMAARSFIRVPNTLGQTSETGVFDRSSNPLLHVSVPDSSCQFGKDGIASF